MVVLSVAETLRVVGGDGDGIPSVSATMSFIADDRNIQVATVTTNLRDSSTDTVVYAARPSVEPQDQG